MRTAVCGERELETPGYPIVPLLLCRNHLKVHVLTSNLGSHVLKCDTDDVTLSVIVKNCICIQITCLSHRSF